MTVNLFSRFNIKNTFMPNGETNNPNEECEQYEKLIESFGGIDLQVLGIGQNGHIGFNEPNERLNCITHITELTENTIEVNSKFFDNADEMPRQALTMGVGTILKARKIIVLVSGKEKSNVVRTLLKNNINTRIPATVLNSHPDVVLICDKTVL